MDNLTESVQKAIKESLPALAANELSQFIEQANRDKKQLEEHREVVRKLSLSTVELSETIKGLESKLTAYKDLEKREDEVKADLMNAVKAKEDVFKLAEIAFRNPRLVHSEHGTIPVGVSSNGGYVSSANTSLTKSVEETK